MSLGTRATPRRPQRAALSTERCAQPVLRRGHDVTFATRRQVARDRSHRPRGPTLQFSFVTSNPTQYQHAGRNLRAPDGVQNSSTHASKCTDYRALVVPLRCRSACPPLSSAETVDKTTPVACHMACLPVSVHRECPTKTKQQQQKEETRPLSCAVTRGGARRVQRQPHHRRDPLVPVPSLAARYTTHPSRTLVCRRRCATCVIAAAAQYCTLVAVAPAARSIQLGTRSAGGAARTAKHTVQERRASRTSRRCGALRQSYIVVATTAPPPGLACRRVELPCC